MSSVSGITSAESLYSYLNDDGTGALTSVLDSLVSGGTLTQSQADNIASALAGSDSSSASDSDSSRRYRLETLVDNGVLTSVEAKTVQGSIEKSVSAFDSLIGGDSEETEGEGSLYEGIFSAKA